MEKALLYNSEDLTREEEALRIELLQWAHEKYLAGHRPIPIGAALGCASKECIKDGAHGAPVIFAK